MSGKNSTSVFGTKTGRMGDPFTTPPHMISAPFTTPPHMIRCEGRWHSAPTMQKISAPACKECNINSVVPIPLTEMGARDRWDVGMSTEADWWKFRRSRVHKRPHSSLYIRNLNTKMPIPFHDLGIFPATLYTVEAW